MGPHLRNLPSQDMEPLLLLMEQLNRSHHPHMPLAMVSQQLLPLMVMVLTQVTQPRHLFRQHTVKVVIRKWLMGSNKKAKFRARHLTPTMDRVGILRPMLLHSRITIKARTLKLPHHKLHLKLRHKVLMVCLSRGAMELKELMVETEQRVRVQQRKVRNPKANEGGADEGY
uniref:Uncharacterized protein n=1 Tax=Opuntia streptacantha TaxID=393608 RepID=A0A7C8Z8Q1_OPUST